MAYELISLPYKGAITDLGKAEVKKVLPWFLSSMSGRMEMLEGEVRRDRRFAGWEADYTPESLLSLGEWFAAHAENRPRTKEEVDEIKRKLLFEVEVPDHDLTDKTYSLSADVGAYLGFVLERRVPGLKWGQKLGSKTNADYGWPVLMGKTKVAYNTFRIGQVFARKFADNKVESDLLKRTYDTWVGIFGGNKTK